MAPREDPYMLSPDKKEVSEKDAPEVIDQAHTVLLAFYEYAKARREKAERDCKHWAGQVQEIEEYWSGDVLKRMVQDPPMEEPRGVTPDDSFRAQMGPREAVPERKWGP